MRVLITDMNEAALKAAGGNDDLTRSYDVIVGPERIEGTRGCVGCFGCWVKTPGRCIVHDGLAGMGTLLGAASEVAIMARNTYGAYAPLAKKALDRSLGYLHCDFRVVRGETHHRLRYGNAPRLTVWLYGPSTEEERATAVELVRRNALNMGATLGDVWFPSTPEGCGLRRSDAACAEGLRAACGEVRAAREIQVARGDALGRVRRVALVNGSPRGATSATQVVLDDLAEVLGGFGGVEVARLACRGWDLANGGSSDAAPDGGVVAGLAACDTAVLGFPLYFDALPSHVLRLLEALPMAEPARPGAPSGVLRRLYAVCNLGFYEASQIELAFRVLANACAAKGLVWGGGVMVGAGGMIVPMAPLPRMSLPRRRVSEAVDALAAGIHAGETVGNLAAGSIVPRRAYVGAAQMQWRQQARAHGVSPRELGATPEFEGLGPEQAPS